MSTDVILDVGATTVKASCLSPLAKIIIGVVVGVVVVGGAAAAAGVLLTASEINNNTVQSTAQPTSDHSTGQPTSSLISKQTTAPTISGQTTTYTVLGQSSVPTLSGQTTKYTVLGQSTVPTLSGQTTADVMLDQSTVTTLSVHRTTDAVIETSTFPTLSVQTTTDAESDQPTVHTLSGQTTAYTVSGQKTTLSVKEQTTTLSVSGQTTVSGETTNEPLSGQSTAPFVSRQTTSEPGQTTVPVLSTFSVFATSVESINGSSIVTDQTTFPASVEQSTTPVTQRQTTIVPIITTIPISTTARATCPTGRIRTVIFLNYGGQGDVYLRGDDVPLTHRSLGANFGTYDMLAVGDTKLDWNGKEIGQSSEAQGTPTAKTTNIVTDSLYHPLNTFGPNHWMMDACVDCTGKINSRFEFKMYVNNNWESINGYTSLCTANGNHLAECGKINVLTYMNSGCQTKNFEQQ